MKILVVCVSVLLSNLLFTQPVMAKSEQPQELDNIIAIVNDDVITRFELDLRLQLIKKQLRERGNVRLPEDSVLRKQVLERMITEQVQLQIAERSGIRIDDETINKVISNIAKENKLSMEQFRQVLERDGVSFEDFRENIKTELVINRLHKQQIHNKINITESEIDNFLSNKKNRGHDNTEYHLGHILIATPEAATPAQIQQARQKSESIRAQLNSGNDFEQTAIAQSDGPQALKGGDLGWRKATEMPEFIGDATQTLNIGQISDPLRSASGFHLIKLLGKRNPDTGHKVQQTLARHILIRPNQIISNDEARQRLEKLRHRIVEQGEEFGQLAQSHSEDPGSAANEGSLGWFGPGTMVPQFEEEMNKLKVGEISPPFRTQFGWHIVQVMSRRQHDNTEEFLRNQARQAIGSRKSEEETQNWLQRLRSESYIEYRFNQ
ncbi:MAG: peptidylprolyl isomerase [Gammaproteobacteria bacterium]|nr:peptidylprolyl isomerase [Gammaproteobacteria bacterium]